MFIPAEILLRVIMICPLVQSAGGVEPRTRLSSIFSIRPTSPSTLKNMSTPDSSATLDRVWSDQVSNVEPDPVVTTDSFVPFDPVAPAYPSSLVGFEDFFCAVQEAKVNNNKMKYFNALLLKRLFLSLLPNI